MPLDKLKSHKHWLVCRCGNAPHIKGYVSCLEDGTPVEENIHGSWDGHLYACMGCGAIYDAESFEQKGVSKTKPEAIRSRRQLGKAAV